MVTKQELMNWVGSDNTMDWLTDCLVDVANGKYTSKELREDIEEYNKE